MDEEELGPKTVFTIKHSEIPLGKTQCENHAWIKKNESELECTLCSTCVIMQPKQLNELILK